MATFTKLPLITAALMLAACNNGSPSSNAMSGNDAVFDNAAQIGNEGEGSNVAQGNIAAGNVVVFKEGESEFRFSWPDAAARIAPLDARLRASGEELRKEMETGMRAEQTAAREGGYPFRGYTYQEDWAVVADLPTLLILRSEGYSYTGGAHGMPIVKTLYWNKAASKVLQLSDIVEPANLGNVIRERFCKALDAERAQKRGEPTNPQEPSAIPEFDQCVDPTKQTVVFASQRGNKMDTIHIVIMPYEAGPYSEGIYDVDLPVDAATLGVVKPAWKSVFAAN